MNHHSTMFRHVPLLTVALACLAFSPLAFSQAQPVDFSRIEITATKVADNFYVIDETEAHGGAISVLTGADGVVMVDTGVAQLAPKVEAAIRKLSPLPIRYVINTHAHVDETGGNEYFAKLGATLVARDEVRESMLHPRGLPAAAGAGAGEAGRQARQVRPPAAESVLPRLTYARDMALHINGQEIRLVSVPRAHTDGDALICFPGLDIVVVGDVLRAHEFPSIGRPDGGTLPGMFDALAKLIALSGPATKIVTSHGLVVDRGVVMEQRDFLLTSRDRIAKLLAQGKSADEVAAANVTADLGVKALPGHIGADAFVRDVYAELKGAP